MRLTGRGGEKKILFKGRTVEWVESYRYLGCQVFCDAKPRKSVTARLEAAERGVGGAMGLCASIGTLSPHSRMSFFRGTWEPAATYSLEALPIRESDIQCLDSLQVRFVRWSLRLPWNSFVFPTLAAVGLRPMREILSIRVGGYLRSLSLARLALPQALWACHRRGELRVWSGSAKRLV
mmetsp:Transcript_14458/g.29101  ORF Transcript_14458/g.29101 Transcript_14458/m.29101 type:complete len:179 (-) Transcript_14458:822-1358(-)